MEQKPDSACCSYVQVYTVIYFYNFGVVNLNKINLTVFCSVRITVHIKMAEEKMEVVRMDILSVSVMKRVVEYSQGCSFSECAL